LNHEWLNELARISSTLFGTRADASSATLPPMTWCGCSPRRITLLNFGLQDVRARYWTWPARLPGQELDVEFLPEDDDAVTW
jgi:hypothetical protein